MIIENEQVQTEEVQTSNGEVMSDETVEGSATAEIEAAIDKAKESKENAILKSYFKQNGLSEEEAKVAISKYKEEKKAEKEKEAETKRQEEDNKSQALKDAEEKNQKIAKALKMEKIQKVALTKGVDSEKLSLFLKLLDIEDVEIDDSFNINETVVGAAIDNVLATVPEFKTKQTQQGDFGAIKQTKQKTTEDLAGLSYREKLAIKYGK